MNVSLGNKNTTLYTVHVVMLGLISILKKLGKNLPAT